MSARIAYEGDPAGTSRSDHWSRRSHRQGHRSPAAAPVAAALDRRRAEEGVTALDITDPEACERVFQDADAVVHLAAVPDPAASWDRLVAPNVIGAYHVAQAAADVGVRRLVLASSLHAVSAVPETTQARGDDAPRPGNLYGATKAWAEALGAWVAATTSTTVVALRIGYFAIEPPDLEQIPTRDLAAWLSARDAAELVRAAVESEGLTFVVANGISANRFRRADLEQTVSRLGYQPVDDTWAQLTDRELRSGRHG